MKLSAFRNALEDALREYQDRLVATDGVLRGSSAFIALSAGFREGVTRALRIAEAAGKVEAG